MNGGDNSLCRGGVCAFVGFGLALAVERRARAAMKTFTTFLKLACNRYLRRKGTIAPADFSQDYGPWI